MIYIKTDMKEMPKACVYEEHEMVFPNNNSVLKFCPYIEQDGCICKASKTNPRPAPIFNKRPEWCPLVRKEDIK